MQNRKVTNSDKYGEETTKTIFYRLQDIDREIFIANSLSNLVNDLDNNNFIFCCKKVFIHMNSWMIGKNLLKLRYL